MATKKTEVPAEQEVMNTTPTQNVDPDVLAALKAEMMAAQSGTDSNIC